MRTRCTHHTRATPMHAGPLYLLYPLHSRPLHSRRAWMLAHTFSALIRTSSDSYGRASHVLSCRSGGKACPLPSTFWAGACATAQGLATLLPVFASAALGGGEAQPALVPSASLSSCDATGGAE